MPVTQENKRTIGLSTQYWRQLVEAGMPAQGTESEATAQAIARWDSERVPLNPLQQALAIADCSRRLVADGARRIQQYGSDMITQEKNHLLSPDSPQVVNAKAMQSVRAIVTAGKGERAIALYRKVASGERLLVDYVASHLSFDVMDANIRDGLCLSNDWAFICSWQENCPF